MNKPVEGMISDLKQRYAGGVLKYRRWATGGRTTSRGTTT